ncbi:PDF receptor-like isoform X3 [Asterias amurensis]|uniref:PDF receptor-like isoform X3 n=1 Tax=Asterias amurensis TaxID=7602 RepID=UPI003AB759E3
MTTSEKECDFLKSMQTESEDACPIEYDKTMCWPETPLNTTAYQLCPDIFPQLDPTKFAQAFCREDGTWGLFDYLPCFRKETEELDELRLNISDEKLEFTKDVIYGAKAMEIAGLFLSFFCLVFALCVFSCFRSLQCHRTKIHKHLFAAYIARLFIEIILGVNQIYKLTQADVGFAPSVISSAPALCVILEVLREYTRLCTFAWMFIEGMYLNSLLSSAVFGKPKFLVFYIVGWVVGIPLTITWGLVMHFINGSDRCWYDNITSDNCLLIIEIPRNAFLAMNLLFLINILRVLVTKLRESNTSETKQVRKAIKATFVLLPLLGVANLIWLIPQAEASDSRAWLIIYYYGILFLDAYQGFFVAVLYCFMNAEVGSVLRRKWSTWRTYHNPNRRGQNMIRLTVYDDGHCKSET